MSWKPSEGLRRAGKVMEEIQEAMRVSGAIPFYKAEEDMFLWRTREIVAKALDQALSDGSEQDAIAAVVGNGAAPHNERGATPAWAMEVPPTADPVGVDLPDFPQPGPVRLDLDTLGEPAASAFAAELVAAERGAVDAFGPAPKKRGRPKGSTNKAKKKAKAAKAKAAPVAESATTEPEAPAGEASS